MAALMALPAAALVLVGCGDEMAGPATTAADRNAAGAVQRVTTGQKTVVTQVGSTFVVSLRERPATGYRWAATGRSAGGRVVDPVGVAEVPDDRDAAGGTTTREFTYLAVKQGQGTLRFEYARPWEDAAIDTKTFDVVVRG